MIMLSVSCSSFIVCIDCRLCALPRWGQPGAGYEAARCAVRMIQRRQQAPVRLALIDRIIGNRFICHTRSHQILKRCTRRDRLLRQFVDRARIPQQAQHRFVDQGNRSALICLNLDQSHHSIISKFFKLSSFTVRPRPGVCLVEIDVAVLRHRFAVKTIPE